MADLTTIILTFNEELNIADCIKSVKSISKRILVVDSFSSDSTVTIAQELGAEVYQHKFVNQAKQFKYAIDMLDIKTTWIMRLDADERLTVKTSAEIEKICSENENTDTNGIIIRFEVNFLGRKLRHGGIYPFRKLAVFKKELGEIEDRNMDEHIILKSGKAVELKNDSIHNDYKDLYSWIEKHNKYSSREVLDFFESDKYISKPTELDRRAKVKRFFKFNVYYKFPMGIRAFLYYIYRYYFKLGFLDGKEGKIFAFLQAYWYRFLIDAKIYEKNQLLDIKEKNKG